MSLQLIKDKRTIIIAVTAVLIVITLVTIWAFSNLRSRIEPDRAEVERSVNQVTDTANQTAQTARQIVENNQQNNQSVDLMDARMDPPANTLDFYTRYIVQTLSNDWSLLSIPSESYNLRGIREIISKKEITYDDRFPYQNNSSFVLLNKTNNSVYVLGSDILYNLQELNFDQYNKWLFVSLDLNNNFHLYTIDEKLSMVNFYEFPDIKNVTDISIKETILELTQQANKDTPATITKVPFKDLSRTGQAKIRDYEIKLQIVPNNEPEGQTEQDFSEDENN